MKEIGVFAAKTYFSKLLEEVANGNQVIITKRGVKIAVLTPITKENNLRNTYSEETAMNASTENFADFLLNSPLAGAELDLQRNQSLTREIDL